jgi:hypothetical protein
VNAYRCKFIQIPLSISYPFILFGSVYFRYSSGMSPFVYDLVCLAYCGLWGRVRYVIISNVLAPIVMTVMRAHFFHFLHFEGEPPTLEFEIVKTFGLYFPMQCVIVKLRNVFLERFHPYLFD